MSVYPFCLQFRVWHVEMRSVSFYPIDLHVFWLLILHDNNNRLSSPALMSKPVDHQSSDFAFTLFQLIFEFYWSSKCKLFIEEVSVLEIAM